MNIRSDELFRQLQFTIKTKNAVSQGAVSILKIRTETWSFCRQIGDKIIIGDVKEKEQAKLAYEDARRRGQSAGLVAQK